MKNTARYDQQTEILISGIIDNFNHLRGEQRKQTHDKYFVEAYTLSQGINKFGVKVYDVAFG